MAEALATKPQIAAANKIDALDDPSRLETLKAHLQRTGIPLYAVSAATGEGLPLLLEAAWKKLEEHRGAIARRSLEEGGRVEER